MIEHLIAWFFHETERTQCFLIGVGFVFMSAVTWYVQKENRIGGGLYDIASAIRERKK